MKKLYSTIMMLAMMVAALSFTSCSSDDEPSISSSDLIGTWSVQPAGNNGLDDDFFEYMQLKSDGTYIDVSKDGDEKKGYIVDYGRWKVLNNQLVMYITIDGFESEDSEWTWFYDIIKKEKNKITISILGVTAYLVRVDDSVIEKYLK